MLGVKAHHQPHPELDLTRLRQRHHLLPLLNGQGKGFLTENMLPRPHAAGNLFTMHKHRRGNVNRIDFCRQEFFQAFERRYPKGLGNFRIYFRIAVVHTH